MNWIIVTPFLASTMRTPVGVLIEIQVRSELLFSTHSVKAVHSRSMI